MYISGLDVHIVRLSNKAVQRGGGGLVCTRLRDEPCNLFHVSDADVFIPLEVSHKLDGRRAANVKTSVRIQPGDHREDGPTLLLKGITLTGWLVAVPRLLPVRSNVKSLGLRGYQRSCLFSVVRAVL